MEEIWKDIPDFDGYQVSNLGKVKSFIKNKQEGQLLMAINGNMQIINRDFK